MQGISKTKLYYLQKSLGRQSHCSLENSKKTYLPEHINIKRMYKLFMKFSLPPLCLMTHRMIFITKSNISFGYSRADTCAECNAFTAKMQIDRLTTMNILNKERAQALYDFKRKSKLKARKHTKNVVICVDCKRFIPAK
ncbi:hypothetical protein PR048_020080 [Dryococelus australis]|uniref:Uncharacterized protein n=1 Tax=Dryococelus australis TaxID=614101 RepID=A0ABQ9H5A6_9NEOP|nr:hypothetical protein PR048_020080 [Dryococelus australis]